MSLCNIWNVSQKSPSRLTSFIQILICLGSVYSLALFSSWRGASNQHSLLLFLKGHRKDCCQCPCVSVAAGEFELDWDHWLQYIRKMADVSPVSPALHKDQEQCLAVNHDVSSHFKWLIRKMKTWTELKWAYISLIKTTENNTNHLWEELRCTLSFCSAYSRSELKITGNTLMTCTSADHKEAMKMFSFLFCRPLQLSICIIVYVSNSMKKNSTWMKFSSIEVCCTNIKHKLFIVCAAPNCTDLCTVFYYNEIHRSVAIEENSQCSLHWLVVVYFV